MPNDPYRRHESILKKVKLITLVFAAVYAALGVALILFPAEMQTIMGFVVGVLSIVVGAYRLYIYFKRQRDVTILATDLFLGIVCILIGVLFIVRREAVMNYVFFIYGILMLAGGIIKLQNALDLYHLGLYRWWIILLLGIVSMGLGVLLIIRPEFILSLQMLLAGIVLIFDAAAGFFTVFLFDSTVKKLKNNIPIGRPERPADIDGVTPMPPVPPVHGMSDENVFSGQMPYRQTAEDPFDPAVVQAKEELQAADEAAVEDAVVSEDIGTDGEDVHMNFDPDTGEPLN